jgi:hypothetical protein
MHTPCAGFSKKGTRYGYQVSGPGYLAPGTRYRVPNRRRGPDIEHRGPGPSTGKRAHRARLMQDRKGSDPGYPVPGTWYLAPMPHSHISNFNRALP